MLVNNVTSWMLWTRLYEEAQKKERKRNEKNLLDSHCYIPCLLL